MEFSPELIKLKKDAENRIQHVFEQIDEIAEFNSIKVSDAFRKNRVSETCFYGSTGYGYDDAGREVLDNIFADVFGAEKALVRLQFVNGTHALATALYACLAPGDTLLSVTGCPYETLRNAIGCDKEIFGSLKYYGINYKEIALKEKKSIDISNVRSMLLDKSIKTVLIQRSKGYDDRESLFIKDIENVVIAVKEINPEVIVMVDNCYGEFTERLEPCNVGADIIAGSLIKNPGGGIAPMGGYIAGRSDLIERASNRLTCPGIGGECGATLGYNRSLYQGIFVAPHVVAQALKTAVFCASLMDLMGYDVSPGWYEKRTDIIQMIRFNDGEKMKKFCRGIQAGAPVDSFVSPEPWQMPGYNYPVIMAAGSFIQGSSIELSADGPFKAPYTVYLQGGLTYETGKYGVMTAANEL